MLTSFIILSLTCCYAGDGAGELFQRLEIVAGDEHVRVRERGGHTSGQGLIAGGGLERVHPDDPVGQTLDAGHLLGEHRNVSAVPAVREYDHHGAARHAALSPAVHELLDGVAEAGPA